MSLKVAPHETNEDLCKTSIDILIEKCTHWFRREEIDGPLWFADSSESFPYQNEKPINIVLFGGFLKRFLESGNWDFTQAKLWVLSHAVQEVLSQLLGIPADHIGVIPRYELFPTPPTSHPFPNLKDGATFVFAGRISSVKNIKMLLETVSSLQMDYHCPVQLALIGDYDNQTHADRGRFEQVDFQNEIQNLLQQLPWQFPPVIKPKMGTEQWPLLSFANPVYVNFSTFMCEDFDVSTAQVQSLGWPCLVTDWGGHLEVTGNSVLKIAPSSIAHDHEPAPVRQIKAKALAKRIWQSSLQTSGAITERSSVNPSPLSQYDLDRYRRNFVSKYQDGIVFAYREGLDHFADTTSGKNFFAAYRTLFTGSSEQQLSTCVLINDLHLSKNPHLTDASAICRDIIQSSRTPVKFVSLRDLFAMDSLKAIASCDSFILPFLSEDLSSLMSHFISHINPQKLVIYTRKNLFTEHAIKTLLPLRAQDHIVLYDCPTKVSEELLAHS